MIKELLFKCYSHNVITYGVLIVKRIPNYLEIKLHGARTCITEQFSREGVRGGGLRVRH